MIIRRFKREDSVETSQLIARTLRECNSKDYTQEFIESNIKSHSSDIIIKRAQESHMYVICDNLKIVGCGAIAGYYGSTVESILLTVFILPEYQGIGLGRKLIDTLEKDEYFLRAHRIEIPSSITSVDFYIKMGYQYKNGIKKLDSEQLYRLEKFR